MKLSLFVRILFYLSDLIVIGEAPTSISRDILLDIAIDFLFAFIIHSILILIIPLSLQQSNAAAPSQNPAFILR